MAERYGAARRTRFAGEEAAVDAERLLFAEHLDETEVSEILARYGFEDPKKADSKILEMAGPPPVRRALAQAMPVLLEALRESADPDRTLVNLKRLVDAYGARETIYSLLADDPGAVQALVKVFSTSQFLADTVVRWPHLMVLFFDRERLLAPKSVRRFEKELADTLAVYERPESALDALRAFKRRELVRIGERDIIGRADLLTTTAELSALADVCVRAALRIAASQQEAVVSPGRGCRFSVIAMGKLGGRELNYSSDIDLMFVYDLAEGADPEQAHRYFTKLAELAIAALAKHTPEGHAYRVDTTLRPEGRDGPLARSLASYRQYYERWAETWELQALIKARPVAGDKTLGAEFVEMVDPIVYRESLAPDEIARTRAMKERIEEQVQRQGLLHREVKLGYGGIRDIEFTVQLLQLVYAYREPRLKGGNTLRALGTLRKLGIILEQEYQEISRAYEFLRRVEHRLQIMQSLKEHALPADPERLDRFARRFGYEEGTPGPGERFAADYQAHAESVRRFFTRYFLAESYRDGPAKPSLLLAEGRVDATAAEALARAGFSDIGRVSKACERLVKVAGGVDAGLLRWLERVLSLAGRTPDPDAAVFHLGRFADAIGGGPDVVRMLAEGRFVLDLLLRVFGSSEFLAEELVRHPEFLDVLASATSAFREKSHAELVREMREATAVWGIDTQQQRLDAVRRFKRRETVRIGALDLVGGANVRTVSEQLSRLADACMRETYSLSLQALAEELGMPSRSGFAVIGLGKLGGRELNYSSDLDVIFVYRGDGELADGTPYTEFWTRLASRIMASLAAPTAEGSAYIVDANLRPEGRDGPLVRSLGSHAEYYQRHAELWEFQALIKARPICGDVEMAGDFMQMLQHLVYREEVREEELDMVRHLKERMERERLPKGTEPWRHVKLGPGGISDIEFAVQILQLRHGRRHRSTRRANTFEALRQLAKENLLAPADAKVLTRGLDFLRRVELRLQIYKKRPEHVVPADERELGRLAKRLGYQGDLAAAGREFMSDYRTTLGDVRRTYERLSRAGGG